MKNKKYIPSIDCITIYDKFNKKNKKNKNNKHNKSDKKSMSLNYI